MKNSPTRKKIAKITAEIEQIEKNIAESNKKLAELRKAKLEAENAEIISLVRGSTLSVDDIAELIADFANNTKTNTSVSEKSTNTDIVKGYDVK